MKKLIAAALLAGVTTYGASAQTYVNGYVRSDGTYVAPHYRSSPNSSVYDNYSTRGNVNPYTGQVGTVNPYASPYPPLGSYSAPQVQGTNIYGCHNIYSPFRKGC